VANPGQVGFAVANPLLVKVMPFHQANWDIQIQCLQRQNRSLFAGFKVFPCPGTSMALLPVGAHYAALFPCRGIFVLSAHLVVKVQLQLRKSSRWSPSWLGVYFERLLCYNDDNRNYFFCCRLLNVSNLCFWFVWRIYKIYFWNNHCRIGGAKNG